MTILAVVNGQIYTDSHAVMEGLALSTNKVRSCELGTYAVAGNPAVAARHIGRCLRAKDRYLANDVADPDCTCVVMRLPDDSIVAVYLGAVGECFDPVNGPDNLGIQYVAGSGRTFFLAYLAEHGDPVRAIELTAKYHTDVALPISIF